MSGHADAALFVRPRKAGSPHMLSSHLPAHLPHDSALPHAKNFLPVNVFAHAWRLHQWGRQPAIVAAVKKYCWRL